MKILGLITEYNPFHYGHLYHLEKSKEISGATHTVAVMSGSFVQRGEPSLVDKWTKAKMAIDNGVDLVTELPFIYAVESAEFFALGAIKILDSLNIVDSLGFGSESGNIKDLHHIANIFYEEPQLFKDFLQRYLKDGLSFPLARSKALADYLAKDSMPIKYSNILKQSNNILAIEYLKALKRLDSNIEAFTFSRLGDDYNDKNIYSNYPSATSLRNLILSHGLEHVKDLVPALTYEHLQDFYRKHGSFNTIDNYNKILKYLLRIKDEVGLRKLLDIDEGLDNRLKRIGSTFLDIAQLIDDVSTKRYPKTRIKRILMHLLLDLHSDAINEIFNKPVEHIRILGSNKKGFEILNKIKNQSNVNIVTKYSHYKKLENINISKILYYEEKATDIYFLGIDEKETNTNMDYLISPYIK